MRKPPNDRLDGKFDHVAERTCILTREAGARDTLVRLALGPDDIVMPDIRAKAPGRGAWIAVDRAALEKAQGNGKLKGALARAFKQPVSAPDDLGERIETALRQAVLDRLGLEARAGTLLTGAEKIDVALRRGEAHLLIHASDAGEDGNRKLDQAWRVGGNEGQGLVFPADRTILSLALGRQNVVHAALIDRAAAQRVRHALERWRAFTGETNGLETAIAGTPHASADDVNEG
ncbi:MAG TPA: RNA-binding protein [Allosphingosinicella sp.]